MIRPSASMAFEAADSVSKLTKANLGIAGLLRALSKSMTSLTLPNLDIAFSTSTFVADLGIFPTKASHDKSTLFSLDESDMEESLDLVFILSEFLRPRRGIFRVKTIANFSKKFGFLQIQLMTPFKVLLTLNQIRLPVAADAASKLCWYSVKAACHCLYLSALSRFNVWLFLAVVAVELLYH